MLYTYRSCWRFIKNKLSCVSKLWYIFLLAFQDFCFTLKVDSIVRGGLVGPNKS